MLKVFDEFEVSITYPAKNNRNRRLWSQKVWAELSIMLLLLFKRREDLFNFYGATQQFPVLRVQYALALDANIGDL